MPISIKIPDTELWDPTKEEFIQVKGQVLTLEHSLLSVDKWESKWKKPYLSEEKKSAIEVLDYLRCMTLTKNVNPFIYYAIPDSEFKRINEYIQDPMTATTFNNRKESKSRKREVITSEIIYWEMTQLKIPMEWEKRHLNKLLTLIQVASIKSESPQKMSKAEIARQNKALNAARRKKYNTRG